jgi:hypothetical protein
MRSNFVLLFKRNGENKQLVQSQLKYLHVVDNFSCRYKYHAAT